jgi:hypothetical protein
MAIEVYLHFEHDVFELKICFLFRSVVEPEPEPEPEP